MVADFMTKPLQGSAFRNYRNLIMGLLSVEEVANVLTNDMVSQTNHKGLTHKKVRHRSVLDYMGECNQKGDVRTKGVSKGGVPVPPGMKPGTSSDLT